MACALAMAAAAGARAEAPLPKVYIDGDPVAPAPKDPSGNALKGAGLCGAFRLPDPSDTGTLVRALFPQRPASFPVDGVDTFAQSLNDFMDGKGGVAGDPTDPQVHYETLQTPFDLASRTTIVGADSIGDYRDTAECVSYSTSGCKFPASGTYLSEPMLRPFISRYRGFFLVPESWQNIPMHIGFVTQDEVAMRIFQKVKMGQTGPKVYEVISRSPVGPTGAYRVTNTITFTKPGLYPIEILHGAYQSPAVLEMVVFSDPSYIDIDGPKAMNMSLYASGFLLSETVPARFFQSTAGILPFDGQPAQCQQCPRQYANVPQQPQGVCPAGLFCNEAAVCSPCRGDQFCGKSCRVCNAPEPFCVRDPRSAGDDYTCAECRDDPDCKTGQKCITGKCVNPCLCCPNAQYCVATDPKLPEAKNCSECRTNSDCGDRVCDLLNGRCVDKVPDNNTDDNCGSNRTNCPVATANDPGGPRPHCMNGQVCVQCRFDVDCAAGTYCRSGDCVPCTHDRHCGPTCLGCGIDITVGPDGKTIVNTTTEKPFCLAPNGQAQSATCVRCLTNEHCGPGGECDPATHQCKNACTVTCPDGKVCSGSACVQCFTSAQCPCGQCVAGECTNNCGDSTDCRSNQCCSQESSTCTNGRCKPGLVAHGGGLCCNAAGGSIGVANDPVAPAPRSQPLWALLAALGFLGLGRLASARAGRRRHPIGMPVGQTAAGGQSEDRK